MADLKFIGVNLPSIKVQKQADPATDALLIDKVRPSGGLSGALVVEPVAATTGANLTVFRILDGPGGSPVLDITVNNLATKFVHTLSGDLTVTADLTVSGDALVSGQITGAEVWADNSTDFSYSQALTIDPSTSPAYGADGTASIYLGTGSADPSVTGFAASAGSLLLNLDGSAWLKTGVTDTDWDVLFTSGSVSVDLDNVISSAPIDNDVTVPTGSRLIFRDGGGTFSGSDSLLEINRTTVGAGTGLSIVMSGSTGEGLSITHPVGEDGAVITDGVDSLTLRGDQILASDGAAGDPPFSWLSDPNSGIYARGGDAFGFSTNATERMYLENSGLRIDTDVYPADGNDGTWSLGFPGGWSWFSVSSDTFWLTNSGNIQVQLNSSDPAFAALEYNGDLTTGFQIRPLSARSGDNPGIDVTIRGGEGGAGVGGGNIGGDLILQGGQGGAGGVNPQGSGGDLVLWGGLLGSTGSGGSPTFGDVLIGTSQTNVVTVGTTLRSDVDATNDLGEPLLRWRDLYLSGSLVNSVSGAAGVEPIFNFDGAAPQVGGTASWTLISGDVDTTSRTSSGTDNYVISLSVDTTPVWAVDETGTLVVGSVPASATGLSLQGAYEAGNPGTPAGATLALVAATPVAITTSGVGQNAITISDTVDTVTIRGDIVLSDGYGFASSPASGLFFTASNKPTLVVAGVNKILVESGQTYVYNQIRATAGTAAAPSIVTGANTSGIYWPTTSTVGISTGGVGIARFSEQAAPAGGGVGDHTFFALTGTAAAQVAGDSWTLISGNVIDGAAGGTKRVVELSVDATPVWAVDETGTLVVGTVPTSQLGGTVTSSQISWPLLAPDGLVTAPSYSFSNETNSGFYYDLANDEIRVARNGAILVKFAGGLIPGNNASFDLGNGLQNWRKLYLASTADATSPAILFGVDTNSGFFSAGGDIIAVSTNATERMRWANTAITTTVPVQVPVGSSAAPTLVSTTYPTTGLYWSTSTGTVLAVSVDATPVTFFRAGSVQPASNNVTDFGAGGRLWRRGYFGPGSVGLPGLIVATGPTADTSGFWAPANHEIAISTRGREITRWADQEPVGTGVLSHVWHSLTLDGSSLIAGDAWKASTITIDDSGGATGTKRIIEYSVDSDGLGADVVWAVDETGTLVVGTVPSAAMSFPLLAPDGIVTAPSYSFASDPNTGIYRYGEGAIGFALNSSTRIRFADAGIFFSGNPTGNAFVINSGAKATDGGTGDPLIITAEWGGNAGVGAGGAGAALQLTAGQGGAGSGALAAGSGGWAVLRGGDAGAVGAGAGGDGGRVVLRLGAATGAGAAGRFDFNDSAGSVVAYMKSTGVFLGPDGGVGEPTYGFTSAGVNNSGLYLAAANVPAISSNGSEILRVESAGIRVTPDGSVSNVAVSVGGEAGTGMYQATATELSFAANGTQVARVNANDWIIETPQLLIQAGSAVAPGLAFEPEQTMGLYRVAAAQMGLSIDSSLRFFLSTSGIYMSGDGASYNFGSTTSPAATASRSTFFRGQTGYAAAGGAGGNGGTTFVTGGTGGIGGVGFAPGSGANLVFTAGAPGDPNGGPGGALGGQITINHGVDNDGTVRDTTWYAGSGGAAIAALKGTGLFRVLDGSTSTPSLSFLNDTNTGMYLAAADTIGFSTNGQAFVVYPHIAGGGTATYYGTQTWFDGTNIISTDNYSVARLTIENSIGAAAATTQYRRYMDFFSLGSAQAAIALGGLFQAGAGSASAPSLSFLSDDNTGIYNSAANVLGFSTAGTLRMQLTTTALENAFGSAANPSYSFIGDTGTGMFRVSASVLGFATGGVERIRVDGGGILSSVDGSAADPSISWTSDNNTGFYKVAEGSLSVSVNSTEVTRWTPNGIYAANGTVSNAGIGFISDGDTGLYYTATDPFSASRPAINFSSGGTLAAAITTGPGGATSVLYIDGKNASDPNGAVITVGPATPGTNVQGAGLSILAAYSGTSAAASLAKAGGKILIVAGNGGAPADGSSTAGRGGDLEIRAGASGNPTVGTANDGGDIIISAGQGQGAGTDGVISLGATFTSAISTGTDMIPDTDNDHSIGSASARYAGGYFIETQVGDTGICRTITTQYTTTGAGGDVAYTEALADETAYFFEVKAVARNAASTKIAAYHSEICVYREGGGSATSQGFNTIATIEADATMSLFLGVSGNNFTITLTGVAATTIYWTIVITRISVDTIA